MRNAERDGIPRRLTFKKVGTDQFKLMKVLNLPSMDGLVGGVFGEDDLKVFHKDAKVDLVVK